MWNRFWGTVGTWSAVAAMTLLIATAIEDSSGRQAYEHAGPVPAGVQHMDARTYILFDAERAPTPAAICRGGEERQPVEIDRKFDRMPGSWIQCDVAQSWNDPREGSPSFGTALTRIATDVRAVGASLAVLLIALLIVMPPAVRRSWRDRRDRRHRRQQLQATSEDRQAALAAAWARDEIDGVTFKDKLTEILNERA